MNARPRVQYLAVIGLAAVATTVLLDGCASRSVPPTLVGASVRHESTSRTLFAAKREDLLYVSDDSSKVYVYSYPKGQLAETLSGLNAPAGECVDAVGDVWITEYSSAEVVEYAHGGTQPIAVLSTPDQPSGCAVDLATGDLAVAGSALAVYKSAKGEPTEYADSNFPYYMYCTYDGTGNLFADSYGATSGIIAELPKGGSQLETIALNESLLTNSMQWDGSDISIVGRVSTALVRGGSRVHSAHGAERGPLQVYRVSVSGSSGTIVGKVLLKNPIDKHPVPGWQFWISGNKIIGPDPYRLERQPEMLSWQYPAGGSPINVVRLTWSEPEGTALSPAQK